MFQHKNKYHYLYFILAGFNISLDYIFYTYSMGVMDIILDHLFKHVFLETTSTLITFIASAPLISAPIGSAVAGLIATHLGRRKTLIFADLLAICGVILALISSLPAMIIGRLLVGFMVGIITVVNPLYFTEMTPLDYRGPVSSGSTSFMSIGTFLSFLGGFFMPDNPQSQVWRTLLGISVVFPLANLINFLIFFRDETPTHLVDEGKIDQAKQTLDKIYKQGAQERLNEIRQEKEYIAPQRKKIRFIELFTKKYRLPTLVAIVMMLAQQAAGYQIFSVYITEIFAIGLHPTSSTPQVLTVVFGFILMTSEIISTFFSYDSPRKPYIVIGSIIVGIILILYSIIGKESFVSKSLLLIWPIPMACSLSYLPYLITPETLPAKVESIAFASHWLFAFLSVQFYPNAVDALGMHGVFILMGLVVICGAVFLAFTLVETEDKNKDQVLKEYKEKDDEIIHLNSSSSS